MPNRLQHETSPYLRQHANNPVDWYPWGEEAFRRAAAEDKPIFLSIGYSTCHWCHVMARESFEDAEIAEYLNRHFICVKVDKEERPDIDSIYMQACRAFNGGGGGWPMSIFMGPDQRPFFAGSYFPRQAQGGQPGMRQLLPAIHAHWTSNRQALLEQADQLMSALSAPSAPEAESDEPLIPAAIRRYARRFDREYGGFGRAPKFPTPHNLLFLLACHRRGLEGDCLQMAETTLLQMYRGGLFDHVGGGFCRYSTDKYFLVPHFEKMLYDNALLILAYSEASACASTPRRSALFLRVAERTADYALRQLSLPGGGFACAEDADSEGEEGKYYLFTPAEVSGALGAEDGAALCRRYGITEAGNFEGASIPNLLKGDPEADAMEASLDALRAWREANRIAPHRDEKALTAWNGLMVAALCALYRAGGDARYLRAALDAEAFVEARLIEGDQLWASFAEDRRGAAGFLDDYAAWAFAQLSLYAVTLDDARLRRAEALCRRAVEDFADEAAGGFFFTARGGEALILRPKETYDAAVPSGNSLMAWNLQRLALLTGSEAWEALAERQLDFMSQAAVSYPPGYAMALTALLEREQPPEKIVVVPVPDVDARSLVFSLPADAAILLLPGPTRDYPAKDGKTTYYVCKGRMCLAPVNEIDTILN